LFSIQLFTSSRRGRASSCGQDDRSQTMRTIPVFTCFMFLCLTPMASAGEADADKLARAAYLRFCQAFNKKDVDGIMKEMGVPWLASGKPVVKDRAELQKIWKEFAKQDTGMKLPWTKFKVEPVSVLREAAKHDKEFLAKLPELGLTREDRLVNDG